MKRKNDLENDKVSTLLWQFAIPAITAMVVNSLYNIIDRIFVGRGVNELAIAGVTVSFPLMMIMMGFGMLIGIGAATSISIYLGEKKVDEAEHVVGNAIVLFVLISIAVTAVGSIFLKPMLIFFGASPATLPYATDFLQIILFGMIFQCFGFGMNNFIRAEGNPIYSMITQLCGALLNIIFCYIFIFIFKLGIRGSAFATLLAQMITTIMVLGYFYTKRSKLHIKWHHLTLNPQIIKRILTIGLPPFIMQVILCFIMIIFNRSLLTYGGELSISIWGIINSIIMLFMMPIFGLNQGAQPIIGYNYGARNYQRVKETLFLCIKISTVIIFVGYLFIEILPGKFITLFSVNNPLMISMGKTAIRIYCLTLPIVGFQICVANYFQFIGRPKEALILSLSRQVLILIPLLLVLPKFLGLNGIWLSGPISDSIAAIISIALISIEIRELNKQIL